MLRVWHGLGVCEGASPWGDGMKLGRRGFRDEKETSAFEGERWFGIINANRILNGGIPGDEWEISGAPRRWEEL